MIDVDMRISFRGRLIIVRRWWICSGYSRTGSRMGDIFERFITGMKEWDRPRRGNEWIFGFGIASRSIGRRGTLAHAVVGN